MSISDVTIYIIPHSYYITYIKIKGIVVYLDIWIRDQKDPNDLETEKAFMPLDHLNYDP